MELKLSEMLKKKFSGKNLAEVSRLTGINRQRLHDWIVVGKTPSLKSVTELQALASHLGLDLNELLFGESDRSIISSVQFRDGESVFKVTIEKIK
jgi:hypothetical protein